MAKKGWSPLHGIICIWSGTYDDIPDGWVPCDGENGTPNLTDRFVRHPYPLRPPHTKGGTSNHRHTGNVDDDTHSHLNSVGIDGHAHVASSADEQTGLLSGLKLIDSEPHGHFDTQHDPHQHAITVEPDLHSHVVNIVQDTHNHSFTSHLGNNIPYYYVLIYIMKL